MNKLSYGNFDISNGDIAFSATNGYVEPSSELERRKQLSYPLKEVKTFVNNTVAVLESDETSAVQLAVSANSIKYRTQVNGDLTEITTDPLPSGGTTGNLLRKTSDSEEWSDSLPILTTAPTGNNSSGVKLVYLTSEPETKYSGYIYLIKA